jgi:thiol-disulfide isomerase/thioredoxin
MEKNMLNKVIIVALFIGVYFSVISCSKSQAEPNSTSIHYISSVLPAKDGFAVDFKYKQDGKERSFAELTKGKVVFLNFWGTWCGPCRREIPDIIEISKDLNDKDFIVIGIAMEQPQSISAKDAAKKVTDYASSKGIAYINFVAEPSVTNDIKNAYGKVPAVPTTFIIDKNGKIIEKIVGGRDKATFMTSINRILK